MLSDKLTALIRNPETPTYVLRDAVQEEEPAVASVWVVEGQSGSYSDKKHWTVAAYLNREGAEALMGRLDLWLEKTGWGDGVPDEWDWMDRDNWPKPPDDPNFDYVYDGVQYVLYEIPLRVEEGT
jgi:hypothetical protein